MLCDEVPENLKSFIKVYDLRHIKNRYDDIVFTIDKTSTLKSIIPIDTSSTTEL